MSVEAPEVTHACPNCGAEYSGGDACPSCGLLRQPVPCEGEPGRTAAYRCVLCGRAICGERPSAMPARCDAHAHVPIIEGWAQVYTTADEVEAGLIVQNLHGEGIDAQLYDQKDDYVFPVDLGELAIVRVLVPVWEFEDALDLVESYNDGSGDVAYTCPSCGEAYEPGDTACPKCGSSLVETETP